MRTLGIIYLTGYLIDAFLSVIATFAPVVEGASTIVSYLLIVATLTALVLACLNKLQPRRIFFLVSGYYFFMLGCGVVFAVSLVLKLGTHAAAEQTSHGSMIVLLRQQFPWYIFVHWTLLSIWIFLGLYGMRVVLATGNNTEPIAAPNGGPARPSGNSGVKEGPPSVS